MGSGQGCSASVGLSRTVLPWRIPRPSRANPHSMTDPPLPSFPDIGLPPTPGVVQRVVWARAHSDGARSLGQ